MKTNSIEFNKKVYAYILESISGEGYGRELSNDIDKLNFLAETFKSEYLHEYEFKRFGSYERVFEEWVKGLPSSFNIAFEYHEILELSKEWGTLSNNATDEQEWKVLNNWFPMIASKTFQLFRKHNISFSLQTA